MPSTPVTSPRRSPRFAGGNGNSADADKGKTYVQAASTSLQANTESLLHTILDELRSMSNRVQALEAERCKITAEDPAAVNNTPSPVHSPAAVSPSISLAVRPAGFQASNTHENVLFRDSPASDLKKTPTLPSVPGLDLREIVREELSALKTDLFVAKDPTTVPTIGNQRYAISEDSVRLPGGFKLADLPRFDGKVKVTEAQRVRTWLQQVKARFDLFNLSLDEPRYLLMAVSHLDGLAHTWWMNLCSVAGECGGFSSWKEFCEGFTAQFTPPNARKVTFRTLMRLEQGKHDVATYAAMFRSALEQLPTLDVWWQLQMFYDGLHISTATLVETAEPTTLTRAIELAIKFDASRVDVAHRSRQEWSSVRYKGGGNSPKRGGRAASSSAKPVVQQTRFNALDADLSGTDYDSGADPQEDVDSLSSGSGADVGLHALKTGQSNHHKKKSQVRRDKKLHSNVGPNPSSTSQPKNGGKPQFGK